jgi:hypothetical protein
VAALSVMISQCLGLFALSKACVTRGTSFVDDFCVSRGCLGCRSNAAPVAALSLMMSESFGLFALSKPCVTRSEVSLVISESLWAVWAVESKRHPWHQFR